MAVSNQPACPHVLGSSNLSTGAKVMNIAYGIGVEAEAL